MSDAPLILLTADEEVTLRRVAFGESPASTLRAQDLARLRRLRLIDEGKEPRLTASGRVHFDSLPKAAMMGKRNGRSLDEEVERLRETRPAATAGRHGAAKPGPVSRTRTDPGRT